MSDGDLSGLRKAVELCDRLIDGCTDNSCLFVDHKGAGTNGGCMCFNGRGRDNRRGAVALALLLREARKLVKP